MMTRSRGDGRDLVLVLVGAVVVRRGRLELRRAGVDGLEGRDDPGRAPRRGAPRRASSPTSAASWASENPWRFDARASRRRVRGGRARRAACGRRASRPTTSASRSRNHGSMRGARATSLDARAARAAASCEVEEAVGRRRDARAREQLVGRGRAELAVGARREARRGPARGSARAFWSALGEGAADRHHLADRLHPGAEPRRGARQLLERPARDLGDDVVDDRLEARRGDPGDVVARSRRAGSRRRGASRSWRSGSPSPWTRAPTSATRAGSSRSPGARRVAGSTANWTFEPAGLHADAAQHREGVVAHRLVLDVRERLGGRDGDRVAGVHAHRVEVLDRADHDAVVGARRASPRARTPSSPRSTARRGSRRPGLAASPSRAMRTKVVEVVGDARCRRRPG